LGGPRRPKPSALASLAAGVVPAHKLRNRPGKKPAKGENQMRSYIPKQTKLVRERIEAKLEQSLVRKLEKYSEYLNSDRDYIVSQALEIAFKKDKGFTDWLTAETLVAAEHPADIPESRKKGSRE
jgi:hypothetical protein